MFHHIVSLFIFNHLYSDAFFYGFQWIYTDCNSQLKIKNELTRSFVRSSHKLSQQPQQTISPVYTQILQWVGLSTARQFCDLLSVWYLTLPNYCEGTKNTDCTLFMSNNLHNGDILLESWLDSFNLIRATKS